MYCVNMTIVSVLVSILLILLSISCVTGLLVEYSCLGVTREKSLGILARRLNCLEPVTF